MPHANWNVFHVMINTKNVPIGNNCWDLEMTNVYQSSFYYNYEVSDHKHPLLSTVGRRTFLPILRESFRHKQNKKKKKKKLFRKFRIGSLYYNGKVVWKPQRG